MGAAGLTCSTCETAARAGTALKSSVPGPAARPRHDALRDMLSESQERMLIIVQSGREEEVKRIFDSGTCPGRSSAGHRNRGWLSSINNAVVADIPAKNWRRGAGL